MKTLYKSSNTHFYIGTAAPSQWKPLLSSESIVAITNRIESEAADLPQGELFTVLEDAVYDTETGELLTEAVLEPITTVYEGQVINETGGGWFAVVSESDAKIMYYDSSVSVSLPTGENKRTFKGALPLICQKLNEIL